MRALTGRRSRFRKIIRTAGEQRRSNPILAVHPKWYLAGGSGRIASAGANFTACRTAASAPTAAEQTLRNTVITIRGGSTS